MFGKLNEENKLYKSSVMVTAGANQAFVNLVLTLCDAGDSVVMFAPYYFNAYMSFQMTGVTNILVGPGDPKTLHPDPDN
ncbi:aromatic aminotransferase ISS1-like [Cucumis melo]|uniref:Aromatic aminotransferase ISS1-like n=1 Tax=Cucumis melo TaxID=3656 RepID=A0ABM3L0B1_CUCME|nr:aromatic aminotransferase ISS1-like [Cucumis melo]